MTKGLKIFGPATVLRTGTSIVGNMGWETPYVQFDVGGQQYRWQSDLANGAFYGLKRGQIVHLDAFAYADHLRRVTVTAQDGTVYPRPPSRGPRRHMRADGTVEGENPPAVLVRRAEHLLRQFEREGR
jgi:hypothetical protein